MNALEIILGSIVLLLALAITVMVIMQNGKQKNLSGAIAGGAESFFGKQKGRSIDKVLDKATTICAIVFAVLVLIIFIVQPENKKPSGSNNSTGTTSTATSSVASSDESEAADESKADDESADADEGSTADEGGESNEGGEGEE